MLGVASLSGKRQAFGAGRGQRLWLLVALAAFAVSAGTIPGAAAAPPASYYLGALVRCAEATSTGLAVVSVGCGGDSLTGGSVAVVRNGRVAVKLRGASKLNLYEVYWQPFGAASTDAKLVGNVATDCNGDAINPTVRPITNGNEALNKRPVGPLLSAVAPSLSAGVFVLYSRGPYGGNEAGCLPTTFNTVASPTDASRTNALANPAVTLATSSVQFLSGYKF